MINKSEIGDFEMERQREESVDLELCYYGVYTLKLRNLSFDIPSLLHNESVLQEFQDQLPTSNIFTSESSDQLFTCTNVSLP